MSPTPPSGRGSQDPLHSQAHQGQAQTGAQQGQPGGQPAQQSQQPAGAGPTNEQLIQYLMITKGLNRETASEEFFENPDQVKQEYQKVEQLMQSGGPSGQSGSGGSSSHSPGH